jgi:hypothetical protein
MGEYHIMSLTGMESGGGSQCSRVEADVMDGSQPCKCLTRTAPPPAPTTCQFEPIPANVDKIKQ